MRINASDVRVGDYINGLGTVREIRMFQEERSVRGKTSSSTEEDYSQMIAKELDRCYSSAPGHIRIEATLGARSFLPNDGVDVFRIHGVSSKSEAA